MRNSVSCEKHVCFLLRKFDVAHSLTQVKFLIFLYPFCLFPIIIFVLGGGKDVKLLKKEAVRIMSLYKGEKIVTVHAVILDCGLARQLQSSQTLSL